MAQDKAKDTAASTAAAKGKEKDERATGPQQAAGAAARGEKRPRGGSEGEQQAPRPDEVENLSSAKAKPQQGAGGDANALAENVAKQQEERSVFSGPNHDLPDPTPEHTARTPAQMVRQTSEGSGPLEPPTDSLLQSDPPQGYGLSSTDHAYAASGGRTIAGERFDALVDGDGNSVSPDSLFNEQEGKTWVTVDKRVYEQFYYPNTTQVAKRLLYVPGQRVNRAEAERMKAALKAGDDSSSGDSSQSEEPSNA